MLISEVRDEMNLTPRQEEILALIVQIYSQNAEPVGSRTLLEKSPLKVSSATIRNEMVALEQVGFIMKAHSSSGRIPSFDGYRFYINRLIHQEAEKSPLITIQDDHFSRLTSQDLFDFVSQSADHLSNALGLPVVAMVTSDQQRRLKDFRLTLLSDYQLLASIITDHGDVESDLMELNYSLNKEMVSKLEQLIQSELLDLRLDEVSQRMKLTLPLRIQQLTGTQINFAPLVEKAIQHYDTRFYHNAGKNYLFDMLDSSNPSTTVRSLLDLLDGNAVWFDFLEKTKPGIDIKLDFMAPPYHLHHLSIVSITKQIHQQRMVMAIVGPSSMAYRKIIDYLNQMMVDLAHTY